jgi:hypothetical protein
MALRQHGKKGAIPNDPRRSRINLDYAIRGIAPAQAHWGHIPVIGMLGNADWGDCVDAGGGHLAEGWSFWGQGQEVEVTEDQVLSMYATVGGFSLAAGPPGSNPTDNGSTLQAGLEYMVSTGLVGVKAAAFGQLPVDKTNSWQQALSQMGPLMIGIGVGDVEQQAFDNGQIWTLQPQANQEDHCVILCGYQPGIYWCWTWGGIQGMTPGWFQQNCYEIWGVASQEWVNTVRGTDPEGVDLAIFGKQFSDITGKPDPFV